MLAVKERNRVISTWKLPGGLANVGEDFGETARREVREETGVDSEFDALIGLRHQHNMAWARSDIYAVCRMRALQEEVTMDPTEIADCAWITVDEFLNTTDPKGMIHILLRHLQAHPLDIAQHTTPSIVYKDRTYQLYYRE